MKYLAALNALLSGGGASLGLYARGADLVEIAVFTSVAILAAIVGTHMAATVCCHLLGGKK